MQNREIDKNRSSKFQENKSLLLQGILPNAEQIYFREEAVLGDGNCGFTTLGVSREEVTKTLLTQEDNKEARESLSEEIREAFMTEQLETNEYKKLMQILYESQSREDKELNRIRGQLNELPHYKNETLRNTINWLNQHDSLEEAKILSEMNLLTFQAEDALLVYCKGREAFRAYTTALNKQLWLGYKSALLCARTKGITLYIWAKTETPSTGLVLKDYVEGKSAQIIHMLSTGRFTHFNLLVEETRPEPNLERSLEIQKSHQNKHVVMMDLEDGNKALTSSSDKNTEDHSLSEAFLSTTAPNLFFSSSSENFLISSSASFGLRSSSLGFISLSPYK